MATRKDDDLDGITLLVLQPLAADGTHVGRTLVAVDSVGAGVGETVFFVRGKEASFPFHPTEVPADAGIVGIVDHWTSGERLDAMQLARVVGTVVATQKHPQFEGAKLLLVQPVTLDDSRAARRCWPSTRWAPA